MINDKVSQEERQDGAGRVVELFLKSSHQRVREIEIEKISPREAQPRKQFKDIEELAASIRERGVLQPIRIKPAGRPGYYEIIAGERRWRASTMAGLKTIPSIVVDGQTEEEIMLDALIENIQRKDLTAVEKALAIKDLIEHSKLTTGKALTLEEVGRRLGYGKARVNQLLSILKLPAEMKQSFCEAGLNEMHARALNQLKKGPENQKALFQEIMQNSLTGQQALERAGEYLASLNVVKTPATALAKKTGNDVKKLFKRWKKLNPAEKTHARAELQEILRQVQDAISRLD